VRNLSSALIATGIVAAMVIAVVSVSMTQTSGQGSLGARTPDGKPNFSGVWQANNEANWDLQPHRRVRGP